MNLTPEQLAALQINMRQVAQNPGGWAQHEARQHAAVYGAPTVSPSIDPGLATRQSTTVMGGAGGQMLSPLAMEEAKYLGMTPQQYVVDRRLAQTGVRNLMGVGTRFHDTTPEALEGDIRFQQALRAKPAEAATLFEAVTGQNYDKHLATRNAMSADRIKFQRELMQKKIASGEWRQQGTEMMSRKLIPNPAGTGEMILADTYTPLDDTERTWVNKETLAGIVDPEIIERNTLAARVLGSNAPKNPAAPKVATLQNPNPFGPMEPGAPLGEALNTGVNAIGNFFSNPGPALSTAAKATGLADTGSMIANMMIYTRNLLRPNSQLPYTRVSMDRGQDPRRVRAELQSNKQFQELLRKDPQAAMRLVAAMQNQ